MNTRGPTRTSTTPSADRSEDGAFRLTQMAIMVTATLMEFETSDPPSKLAEFLNSSSLATLPVRDCAALWKAGFPFVLVHFILDEDWYYSFAAESLVSGPEAPALSKRSVSVLVTTLSL